MEGKWRNMKRKMKKYDDIYEGNMKNEGNMEKYEGIMKKYEGNLNNYEGNMKKL